MEKEAVNRYSSLALAFLGDAVYELYVRSDILSRYKGRPSALSRRTAALVCATAQERVLRSIRGRLTEEEADVCRRGRNAEPKRTAKNQPLSSYHRATGLEALLGYLYLREEKERLTALLRVGLAESGLLEEDKDAPQNGTGACTGPNEGMAPPQDFRGNKTG